MAHCDHRWLERESQSVSACDKANDQAQSMISSADSVAVLFQEVRPSHCVSVIEPSCGSMSAFFESLVYLSMLLYTHHSINGCRLHLTLVMCCTFLDLGGTALSICPNKEQAIKYQELSIGISSQCCPHNDDNTSFWPFLQHMSHTYLYYNLSNNEFLVSYKYIIMSLFVLCSIKTSMWPIYIAMRPNKSACAD